MCPDPLPLIEGLEFLEIACPMRNILSASERSSIRTASDTSASVISSISTNFRSSSTPIIEVMTLCISVTSSWQSRSHCVYCVLR